MAFGARQRIVEQKATVQLWQYLLAPTLTAANVERFLLLFVHKKKTFFAGRLVCYFLRHAGISLSCRCPADLP